MGITTRWDEGGNGPGGLAESAEQQAGDGLPRRHGPLDPPGDGGRSAGDVLELFGPVMRQRLVGYAQRFLDDAWEAEDVAQETLMRAGARMSALRSAQRAEAWLFRICRHAAIDRVRARRVRQDVWLPLPDEVADAAVRPGTPGRRDAADADSPGDAPGSPAWLRLLPAHQRVLVSLHYEHGLTQPTICRMTGLNAAALRVRLFRARGLLVARRRASRGAAALRTSSCASSSGAARAATHPAA